MRAANRAGREGVKRFLARRGLALSPLDKGVDALRADILRTLAISDVLDVGANEGQFVARLRSGGYRGNIHCFEPGAAAFATLQQRVKSDPLVTAIRAAVGASQGSAELHVAANSVSSSLLPVTPAHTASASNSVAIGTEVVPVLTLDSYAETHLQRATRVFLKLDVQGYELLALRGAAHMLQAVGGLQAEVSLAPLYSGQPACSEVFAFLESVGFRVVGLEPAFVDPDTAFVLQVDLLAVNSQLLEAVGVLP